MTPSPHTYTRLARLFATAGAASYVGEPVSQLAHALQTAALAEADDASDSLVIAALLHDVGHLLHGLGEDVADRGVDGRHELVGAAWLHEHLPSAVLEPIRLHVDAKRYLCATDVAYAAHLSPASRASLALQGGPMSDAQVLAFARLPWAHDAVRLRRWDDAAKTPGLAVPPLTHYRARLERVLGEEMPHQSTSHFDLVVFDVAGTTVMDGDAVLACLCAVMAPYAEISMAEARDVMGLPKPIAIDHLLTARTLLPASERPALVESLHRAFRAAMIKAYETSPLIAPAPGVLEVFARLREAGVRVVLDTGFSRDILDCLLQRLQWTDGRVIDFSLSSDEVPRGRPFPDLIRQAMVRAGLTNVHRVAKVGDTPADMAQGLAAGCGLVLGVSYGTHTREQLERDGVHVVDHATDLLPLFGVAS